jgi:flagellar motor switch/type III secretory pathway protein FliN
MSTSEIIKAWSAEDLGSAISENHLRLSKGFLRSSPSAWFPGLATHWLPLQHSSGVEIKVLEVQPLVSLNNFSAQMLPVAAWSLDQDHMILMTDLDSQDILLRTIIPGSDKLIRPILIEYLARRFALSLFGTWVGAEGSTLLYQEEFNFQEFKAESFIFVRASLNAEPLNFAFALSRGIVDSMDGLWRRQLKASRRSALAERLGFKDKVQVAAEIARLSLAPQEIASYLNSKTLIDLEIPVSSKVILKVDDEAWLSSKIINAAGRFVFETSSTNPILAQVAAGTTALSIELGKLSVSVQEFVEYEQEGAIIESSLPLSNRVNLVIRGEKLAQAELLNYQGRFALKVI